jgi:hypothetical protein
MTIATDIHADLVTPLGAFLRLRGQAGAAFLLESVEKGRLCRYSLVGSGTRLVTAMTSNGAAGVMRSLGVTITAGRSLGIPFASAMSAQTIRPNWSGPGIPVPCVRSKRLRLVLFKPVLGRRGDLRHLRPIDLGRELLQVGILHDLG